MDEMHILTKARDIWHRVWITDFRTGIDRIVPRNPSRSVSVGWIEANKYVIILTMPFHSISYLDNRVKE